LIQTQLDQRPASVQPGWRDRQPQYRFPDFIIAGAMKSGTTSLHAALASDPRIYIPNPEIFFFDMDDLIQHSEFLYLDRGRDRCIGQSYLPNDPATVRWYASFFENARSDQRVGEDSTTYFASSKAAERIADFLPDAKVIIMLRDPASRTYSQYWHAVRTGRAVYDFEDTLRYDSGTLIQRSLYKPQVETFQAALGRDRLLILLFEDFVENMTDVLLRVYGFLALEPPARFDLHATHANAARIPRWHRLQLWRNWLLRPYTDRLYAKHLPNERGQLPSGWWKLRVAHFVHRKVNPLRARRPPEMQPATRRFLNEMFARENEGLSELIGIDVKKSWYRN
jgi:Sulfotransferase family